MFSSGRIDWAAATLKPPQGHQPISSGAISGDTFTFSIDIERDPQSDDFHGLWDELGNGSYLNISGKGTGAVHGTEMTGTFNGVFAFYEPVANPNILIRGQYCVAPDHGFRLQKQ
jgi:hypothetical protein